MSFYHFRVDGRKHFENDVVMIINRSPRLNFPQTLIQNNW